MYSLSVIILPNYEEGRKGEYGTKTKSRIYRLVIILLLSTFLSSIGLLVYYRQRTQFAAVGAFYNTRFNNFFLFFARQGGALARSAHVVDGLVTEEAGKVAVDLSPRQRRLHQVGAGVDRRLHAAVSGTRLHATHQSHHHSPETGVELNPVRRRVSVLLA